MNVVGESVELDLRIATFRVSLIRPVHKGSEACGSEEFTAVLIDTQVEMPALPNNVYRLAEDVIFFSNCRDSCALIGVEHQALPGAV